MKATLRRSGSGIVEDTWCTIWAVQGQTMAIPLVSITQIPHRYYTDSTQIPHRYRTDTTQIPHKYHTNTTQIPHRYHTNTTQIPHRYHTNTMHIQHIYHTDTMHIPHRYHTYTTQIPCIYNTYTKQDIPTPPLTPSLLIIFPSAQSICTSDVTVNVIDDPSRLYTNLDGSSNTRKDGDQFKVQGIYKFTVSNSAWRVSGATLQTIIAKTFFNIFVLNQKGSFFLSDVKNVTSFI